MIILVIVSILINVLISILGVIPSIFLTLYNVNTFGIINGFIISLIGEVIGAIISFYVYRKGFKKISQSVLQKYSKINNIINYSPKEQFLFVLLFRIFPYVPSGFVTYAAAISTMDIKSFTIASTIGKIPAMVIEVALAFGTLQVLGLQKNKINMLLASIIIVVVIIKISKRRR